MAKIARTCVKIDDDLAERLRERDDTAEALKLGRKYAAAHWGLTRALVNSFATGAWLQKIKAGKDDESFARLLRISGIDRETAEIAMRAARHHPTLAMQCTTRGLASGRMSPTKTHLLDIHGESFRSLIDSLLLEFLNLISKEETENVAG